MTNEEAKRVITTLTAGDNEMSNFYSYFTSQCMPDTECAEKLGLLSLLKDHMKEEVVKFVYQKLNGEIRTAFGTRAQDVLTQNGDVPQNKRNNVGTFPYWDIEKKAWRCFKPQTIKSIDFNYSL